ncbi:LOW QUALITY PROTEIN: hypothetical protein CFOL_v3_17050, partial [Cephalotus follicularis]
MFAKRLIEKAVDHHHQHNPQHGNLTPADLDLQIPIHYGIPSTASILAFDSIQRLLAIGTLDGRIKVIGGDGIEGLLISPKRLPYKYLQFLQNQGSLVSISNDNEIQVWNLESRCLACCLQWESNITAFSVIIDSHFMYVGDEYGLMSVIKYDLEDVNLLQLPYNVPANSLSEAAGFSFPDYLPIVGVLSHPCSGNRQDTMLIAYVTGLIILWDVSEARILFVGGGNDLKLKDKVVESEREVDTDLSDDPPDHHLQDKETSALCWASSNGSILAVGYIDGDILFWNISDAEPPGGHQTGLSSSKVVKLQLSSAERRIPVIVLHWSPNNQSCNNCDGQLFIYGGDDIGSEEVLSVFTLEWSSGLETVRCASRVDLTLTGSFADMILLPSAGATQGNQQATLFVLTNPGQLHLYDDASLSALLSQMERMASVCAVEFPAVVPTADPCMTMAMFTALPTGGNSSIILSKMASVMKLGFTSTPTTDTKWPVTGGVPSQLSITKDHGVERLYIAGYRDGTVRIFDVTYPIVSLICIIEGEVQGIKVTGFNSQVSNLDFCSLTSSLAVGNERGLVRIYNFRASSSETSFHFVTESEREVHTLPQREGPQCIAVFSLINSAILALRFANSGTKLAVGFESGRVAVLDMSSLSVLFFTDRVSDPISPIISLTWEKYANIHCLVKSLKLSETKIPVNPKEEVIFILTKDAKVKVFDGGSGYTICSDSWHMKIEAIAISMYVIGNHSVSGLANEKKPESRSQDTASDSDSMPDTTLIGINSHETEHQSSFGIVYTETFSDSLILLCCEDSLHLNSMKAVLQGNNKPIRKWTHAKPCCWTSTFKNDGKVCGLVLLFQTGVIEIRSFPDLELVEESSLMSILRWNFKTSMDKTMSYSDDGLIILANGSELAFISLLAGENCFRIPNSLPCLHDKVLAAAAAAAFNCSLNQKKKQGTAVGILGGVVKGLKGGKTAHTAAVCSTPKSNSSQLEDMFLKSPFLNVSPTVADNQKVEELNIDDTEIDEPVSETLHEVKNINRGKGTERGKLLGTSDDTKPRLRTREEIIAKYRKAADSSSVAAQARNKLVERQEKLE